MRTSLSGVEVDMSGAGDHLPHLDVRVKVKEEIFRKCACRSEGGLCRNLSWLPYSRSQGLDDWGKYVYEEGIWIWTAAIMCSIVTQLVPRTMPVTHTLSMWPSVAFMVAQGVKM